MAKVTTWDGKTYNVPNENVDAFLEQYNADTNYATHLSSPDVNPERGTNFGGGARAFAQGLPVIGSYADETEAYVRSLIGDKSYDEYLKNARESTEGAFKNMPEVAYPLNISAGIAGEAAIAALTGGASLTPQAQALMGAAYGYGMGEGGVENRLTDAAIVGGASAALPVAGRYLVKGGKTVVGNIGKKALQKKIPNTLQALEKVADPTSGTKVAALYKNAEGKTDINILSSLMNTADDYATQSKVATELVKETPKNAGLYKSEIMNSANDLANIGWKNQVTGAIEDVAVGIKNPKDQKILAQIADKLSKATKTTIESADNALEEVELKDVREIVNYAIDKFGKGLSEETKNVLEKRMISEGMAKRVSNKLVNKSLAEGAQKSTWGEIAKDAALGGVANLIGGPGAGVLAVVGKNALRGGTGSTIMKNLTRKATDTVLDNTIEKATVKAAEKTLPRNMKTPINELSPRLYNTYNSLIEGIKNAQPVKSWYKKPINTYYGSSPIIRSLAQ